MKNIALLIKKFILKNNHANCDIGYSYSELHVQDIYIDGVAKAIARHLIANGIGDITEWKHRADVAEEALRNGAVGEDLYCSSDDERHRLYLHLIREAEERLKEAEKNEQRAKKM